MFCENCRTELLENFNFCTNCGYAIDGKQPILNRETKRKINRVFKIIAVCFGAIISAILISAIIFFIDEITDEHIISLTNGINTGAGSSRASAIPITDGYSSSFTIGPKEQHWFKYTNTGEGRNRKSVSFDYITDDADLQWYIWKNNNLISYRGSSWYDTVGFSIDSGDTYFIRITALYGTRGTYTFTDGLTDRFIEVLRPMAAIMSGYESVPAQERRDRYDDLLSTALTSKSAIVSIFIVWKPGALDGMDFRFIGRPGSTPTGQYAPALTRENGRLETVTSADVSDSMAYIIGPNARRDRVLPARNVAGKNLFGVMVPIVNPGLNETVGALGCYFVR